MGDRVKTIIIVIVALVWAANFTAPLFIKDYQPSPELNVAFMAVIGFATASYGSNLGSRNREQSSRPEIPEELEGEVTPPPPRRPARDSSGGVEE